MAPLDAASDDGVESAYEGGGDEKDAPGCPERWRWPAAPSLHNSRWRWIPTVQRFICSRMLMTDVRADPQGRELRWLWRRAYHPIVAKPPQAGDHRGAVFDPYKPFRLATMDFRPATDEASDVGRGAPTRSCAPHDVVPFVLQATRHDSKCCGRH